MFYYIENKESSPYFNLALEQVVFDRLEKRHSYCMLWQNHNSVIVGKHQNTTAEVCASFVETHRVNVVRRLSGGGAVYHDLGNVNFTFITDAGKNTLGNAAAGLDFALFCRPIQEALQSFGVPAEIAGRNDMTIEGKKISGNAQYIRQNRVMHHGTLLYDTDLEALSGALAAGDTVVSKGIKSVQSRVTNIRPYMAQDMPADTFREALRDRLCAAFAMREYVLSADDVAAAQALCDQVYSQWAWNYGASPAYNARKIRRMEGCGTVEVLLDVAKEGIINNIAFYGDFFSNEDPAILAAALTGHKLERTAIAKVLQRVNVARFFHHLEEERFLSLLFE